jgi:hypothetical protein
MVAGDDGRRITCRTPTTLGLAPSELKWAVEFDVHPTLRETAVLARDLWRDNTAAVFGRTATPVGPSGSGPALASTVADLLRQHPQRDEPEPPTVSPLTPRSDETERSDLGKGLVKIGDDVCDCLEADAQPDLARRDASRCEVFGRELAVRGARRVDHKASNVADVRHMAV